MENVPYSTLKETFKKSVETPNLKFYGKRIFCSYGKRKKKNFEKFILVKNIVKEEISPSYYAPNAEEQLSMIAPNLKCSEILGIGIICHFRLVIFC